MELAGKNSMQRVWLARGIAVAADLVQVTLLPVTAEGVFSPVADGIDLAMAGILTLLVGWHIAFIPSFIVKILPVADLAPTWTMAVLVATRGRGRKLAGDEKAPMPLLEAEPVNQQWKPWYDRLVKPRWTPSPSTIGLIWSILYPLIVFSFGWVFWQAIRGRIPAVIALPFAINLIANLCFTPILFRLRNLSLATVDILLVVATIVWAMIWIWPISHSIAIAQVPYLVWVGIATMLQLGITRMNRRGDGAAV